MRGDGTRNEQKSMIMNVEGMMAEQRQGNVILRGGMLVGLMEKGRREWETFTSDNIRLKIKKNIFP